MPTLRRFKYSEIAFFVTIIAAISLVFMTFIYIQSSYSKSQAATDFIGLDLRHNELQNQKHRQYPNRNGSNEPTITISVNDDMTSLRPNEHYSKTLTTPLGRTHITFDSHLVHDNRIGNLRLRMVTKSDQAN